MIDISSVLDLLGAVLLFSGAAFLFITALGLLRLKDTYSRMHSSAKPQWLGVFLLATGTAVSMRAWPWIAAAFLMILLQTVSAPIGSQLMARAAYRNHEFEEVDLVVDELSRDNEQEEAFTIKSPTARGGFARPKDYPDLDSQPQANDSPEK